MAPEHEFDSLVLKFGRCLAQRVRGALVGTHHPCASSMQKQTGRDARTGQTDDDDSCPLPVHRSFTVARLMSAKMKATIQKRITT